MNLFLNKANELLPILHKKEITQPTFVSIIADKSAHLGYRAISAPTPSVLDEGDSITLDFGSHYTGYFSFSLNLENALSADAPTRLRLRFGEIPAELGRDFSTYTGTLSASWLQEEIVNIDEIPSLVKLPRRYSFRYVTIEVIAKSSHYMVSASDFLLTAVSSATYDMLQPLNNCEDKLLYKIDSVATKTLAECMQTVFEDGPKRDRRLWIGDLRLQALANYATFKNYDLVKRCLYLFAGLKTHDYIPACLYEKPKLIEDNIMLMDYSLFYVLSLCDYYDETQDSVFINELWDVLMQQINWAFKYTDEEGLVIKQEGWWCFIDWNDSLDKLTALQGITIYTLKKTAALANRLGKESESKTLEHTAAQMSNAAIKYLYNAEKQAFQGDIHSDQYSWASQIFMILADVLPYNQATALMHRILQDSSFVKPVTPYMHHYAVEAMLHLSMHKESVDFLKAYWGSMIEKGADTFWEIHVPNDETCSCYGDWLNNSFCHAWSCTPTYLIRNKMLKHNA